MKVVKIVSGGQTGVDRAAHDVAIKLGIPLGGWCPQGRKAEDGVIPSKYVLEETPSSDYQVRTDWNVRDSDATLILNTGELEGGTAITKVLARVYGSPCMVVQLDNCKDPGDVLNWLNNNNISTLNVAGPRASKSPNAYHLAFAFLESLLTEHLKD